jgi:hypothetical protein
MDYSTIMLVTQAVHPIATVASCHCWTREYKRKHGGSDNSKFRHAFLLLVSGNANDQTWKRQEVSGLGSEKIFDKSPTPDERGRQVRLFTDNAAEDNEPWLRFRSFARFRECAVDSGLPG